jgi:NAD(P)-dependent dehydrogenase (short-subunit alcohol dehydrogenase family)
VEGKGVALTGAAMGIGRALAERFAAEGASFVAVLDIDERAAKSVAAAIGGTPVPCDVGDRASITEAVQTVESELGDIDVFCSNAGITGGGGVAVELEPAVWDRVWRINTLSHVWAAELLLPRMAARGGGWFVQTISAAALITGPSPVAYTVTKHASLGFAEWLAMNYATQGIRVACICPTAVDTPMFSAPSDTVESSNIKATIGQLMAPEQLAGIVVDALDAEKFLIVNEDKVLASFQRKAQDYDEWIAGQIRRQERMKQGEAKR